MSVSDDAHLNAQMSKFNFHHGDNEGAMLESSLSDVDAATAAATLSKCQGRDFPFLFIFLILYILDMDDSNDSESSLSDIDASAAAATLGELSISNNIYFNPYLYS